MLRVVSYIQAHKVVRKHPLQQQKKVGEKKNYRENHWCVEGGNIMKKTNERSSVQEQKENNNLEDGLKVAENPTLIFLESPERICMD